MLLRHAKSAWPEGMLDHARPLGPRGLAEAPLAGQWLAEEGLVPDIALVSSAVRTRETWDLVAAELDADIPVRVADSLYDAAVWDVVVLLRTLPPDVATAIVVGHNPGMERVAMLLDDGSGPAADRARMAAKFPTSGIAVLTLTVDDWRSLDAQSGRLETFHVPR
jgi:phosphohistidine phosphatase